MIDHYVVGSNCCRVVRMHTSPYATAMRRTMQARGARIVGLSATPVRLKSEDSLGRAFQVGLSARVVACGGLTC